MTASKTRKSKANEHLFCIELKSRDSIKNLELPLQGQNSVVIEGFLGKLTSLGFPEGLMLEINGSNGSLRMDLNEKEMRELLPKIKKISRKRNTNEKNFEANKIG